ncbi:MAG: hypothetical protein QHC78_12820 [Pigmentiphaga sp.]|uniref:hypothetical protein n=1 Tax=Pigmentiphaga sp. TaxID=1977564 RepID=UPI0029BD3502|nr:hypothetical protein [Pigmentiphaga sp.]MDX3906562.1 hypothetical protein [Pigmentiphaga sp.]
MTDIIAKLLRTVFVAGIALVGMIMAAILLASTAVALAIVYVVAKLRGKPFAANAYWKKSQSRWGFGESGAGSSPRKTQGGNFSGRFNRRDVIDVEVRDIP